MAGIWEESMGHGLCFSMITTEPNAVAAAVHDRMPAALTGDELLPFLKGEIAEFLPPPDLVTVEDAPNPLRTAKPPPAQGELF